MDKQQSLEQVLKTLPKEELINIVRDIAEKDASINNMLLALYSQESDDEKEELKKVKTLIQSIVKRYKGRDRFIFYRESFAFTGELDNLLEQTERTKQGMLGLEIFLLVLKEGIKALQYTDDSGGAVGDLIRGALYHIEKRVEERDTAKETMNESMFKKLMTTSDAAIFNDWSEQRMALLEICIAFADHEGRRKRLQVKLDQLLQSVNAKDGYSSRHRAEELHKLTYMLIEKYGDEEERQQFIEDHLQFTYFRTKAIEQCIEKGQFEKVLELALDGEQKDKKWPGLVHKWADFRYLAYKGLSLTEKQAELARAMFFSGDFKYYFELKELSSEPEDVFYNRLKNELKADKGRHGRKMLLQLINEEEDVPELLEFVRAESYYIEQYAEQLYKPYPEEVTALYKDHIKTVTAGTSNRNEYRRVRKLLQKFKSLVGKQICDELIEELREQYPRRPAFLDELDKVK